MSTGDLDWIGVRITELEALTAEARRLRAERDDLQAQTEALTHLNANLRDDLETADVGWRAQSDKRQVAEAERDRLRDGIREIAVSLREFPCAGRNAAQHLGSLLVGSYRLDDNEENRR